MNAPAWSRVIQNTLADYDALMVPTAPTIYRIAEVEAILWSKQPYGRLYQFCQFCRSVGLALPNSILC